MPKTKEKPTPAAPPRRLEAVTITVRPDNIALLHPVVDRLRPLLPLREFVLQDVWFPKPQPDKGALLAPDLSPCSVVPAGLVPRFEAVLAGDGYVVTVDDRRRAAPGLRINTELCEGRHGVLREFIQAAVSEPLLRVGFKSWDDVGWRIACLHALYPEARILIAVDRANTAWMLRDELVQQQSLPVGLLALDRTPSSERCLVTSEAVLPRVRPSVWKVLIVLVSDTRTLCDATFRAIMRLRAQRICTMVRSDLRLGKPTAMRLEAMAGPLAMPDGAD